MIVAVASGKGGTGKTTVAAALARVWERPCLAVDADVEEPNLDLYLRAREVARDRAAIEVPQVGHSERCDGCGACAEICAFKAVLAFGDFPVVFAEMCHGCGGCIAVCPHGVLVPGARELGAVRRGRAGAAESRPDLWLIEGRLRVGEAMSPPLIRQVLRDAAALAAETGADIVIDAPPGTSCPAMAAVRDADAIVLVAEPTPFGLHDLGLAVRAFADQGAPIGVVVNRADLGDSSVQAFCGDTGLPVLAELPFRREIAAACARGVPLDRLGGETLRAVTALADAVRDLAEQGMRR